MSRRLGRAAALGARRRAKRVRVAAARRAHGAEGPTRARGRAPLPQLGAQARLREQLWRAAAPRARLRDGLPHLRAHAREAAHIGISRTLVAFIPSSP
eukprot:3761170-Prymnesium_polylepis.1